jgi:ABC-type branched-subunit amino acid transport system ATPase component
VADVALDLEVEQLTMRFGGTIAVEDLSLRAPAGRITGLIGPNGAGKTTTFNACTGLLPPTHGSIRLGGTDVTRAAPAARARMGLGRTFQRMELYDSVSVRENVALGREARLAGNRPLRHLFARPGDARDVADAAQDAIELCGLPALADRRVASLSTGQRRLVELARAVAGGFSMLLLDEPSSGLDPTETEAFGRVLLRLVEDRGLGILLVEHDMSLVMTSCEHLFVVDFGRLIAEGDPAAIQADPQVRRAYLGEAS